MKRLSLIAIIVVSLALSACGGSKVSSVSSNPEAKQAVAQTETIVKGCVAKSTRKSALLNCIAPKGHAKQLEQCVVSAVAHDAVFHHVRLIKDVSKCVVTYR